MALSQVLLLLLILVRHLLLARRRHLGGLSRLSRLLVTKALSRRWVCRFVLLRAVVSVQVVSIDVVGVAGLIGICIVLVEHGVRIVRRVVFLFCTRVNIGMKAWCLVGAEVFT